MDGATAILAIAGNSDTVGAVSLKNGGSITGTGGTLTGASYAVESGSVSAKLGGSVGLTKSTAGTVTLSGTNTYTGTTTTIEVGKLLFSRSNTTSLSHFCQHPIGTPTAGVTSVVGRDGSQKIPMCGAAIIQTDDGKYQESCEHPSRTQ